MVDEATLRIELAAVFRIAAHEGWHESVANHFSAAVSDDGRTFLMNPRWQHFSQVKASDLLLLDVDDPDVMERPDAPDPSAWAIHGAIHAEVPAARVLLHAHPIHATALAALGALASLGLPTPTEARRTAVTKTTLPARMERFDRDPLVVIDAAHNAASARALSGAIDRLCDPAPVEQRVLVVAISQEKDAEAILREIVPRFRRIIATRFLENPRALPPETIAELVSTIDSAAEVTTAPSPQDAYLAAVDAAGQGGAVVVAGSFFLAAEIRRLVVNAD